MCACVTHLSFRMNKAPSWTRTVEAKTAKTSSLSNLDKNTHTHTHTLISQTGAAGFYWWKQQVVGSSSIWFPEDSPKGEELGGFLHGHPVTDEAGDQTAGGGRNRRFSSSLLCCSFYS